MPCWTECTTHGLRWANGARENSNVWMVCNEHIVPTVKCVHCGWISCVGAFASVYQLLQWTIFSNPDGDVLFGMIVCGFGSARQIHNAKISLSLSIFLYKYNIDKIVSVRKHSVKIVCKENIIWWVIRMQRMVFDECAPHNTSRWSERLWITSILSFLFLLYSFFLDNYRTFSFYTACLHADTVYAKPFVYNEISNPNHSVPFAYIYYHFSVSMSIGKIPICAHVRISNGSINTKMT